MKSTTLLLTVYLSSVGLFPPVHSSDPGRRAEPGKTAIVAKKEDLSKADENARGGEKGKIEESAPAGAYDVEVTRNIAYRLDPDADPVRHKLDIYTPKGQRNFPVVMFVHGGGWHSGNKELYAQFGQLMARNGLGGVVINYRLSPQARFPAHEEDVAKAFAWVHANIARYGGRADRLIVCGHSAGGHLVSLLATDERYLKAENLTPRDIRGVISMSGVYALDKIFGMYGSIFGRDRADRRDASPLHHITGNEAPFCILYADKDLPTIEKVSEQFFDALKKARCDARAQKVSGRTHISLILLTGTEDDPAAQAMFDFIERQTEWTRPLIAAAKEAGKP